MKTIVISSQEELNAFNGNFEGNLDLRGWKDGSLNLEGVTIEGSLDLEGVTIEGSLYLQDVTVKGSLYLHHATVKGSLYSYRTRVEGDFYLQGATVSGDIYLQGATVIGDIHLEGATVRGGIYLKGATVVGNIYLEGTTVVSYLYLRNATVVGNIYLEGAIVGGGIIMAGATVGNIWYPTPTKEDADFLSRVLVKENFDMAKFHSNDLWLDDPQTCGTTHCIRGWAEVEFLENNGKECEDKDELYPNLKWLFYLGNKTARAYMEKIIAQFN